MRQLTKTFVENRWFRKVSPSVFTEIPKSETQEGPAIDVQVRDWVLATGALIVHPGQVGMHISWSGSVEDPYQLKCITIGLTVLYQEDANGIPSYANPASATTAADSSPAYPSAEAPAPGGDPGGTVDGAGPA